MSATLTKVSCGVGSTLDRRVSKWTGSGAGYGIEPCPSWEACTTIVLSPPSGLFNHERSGPRLIPLIAIKLPASSLPDSAVARSVFDGRTLTDASVSHVSRPAGT